MYQEFGACVLVPPQERDRPRAILDARGKLNYLLARELDQHFWKPTDLYDVREQEIEHADGSVMLWIKGKVGK